MKIHQKKSGGGRGQGFFSGVSGAVVRPLSQWQIPTFFPNLDKKNPNQKVFFYLKDPGNNSVN